MGYLLENYYRKIPYEKYAQRTNLDEIRATFKWSYIENKLE